MAAAVARQGDAANTRLCNSLIRSGISHHRTSERGCRRHLVGHLRHDGAEAGDERRKNHDVTHYATLDQRTRRYHHVSRETAIKGGADGYKFGEKGE